MFEEEEPDPDPDPDPDPPVVVVELSPVDVPNAPRETVVTTVLLPPTTPPLPLIPAVPTMRVGATGTVVLPVADVTIASEELA